AIPAVTVQALWDDGPALLDLAAQIERLRAAPKPAQGDAGTPVGVDEATGVQRSAAQIVRPWVDRAVELGASEGLWVRAGLRAKEGDRAGALVDLVEYVAGPQPQHLDGARQPRAALTTSPREHSAPVQ